MAREFSVSATHDTPLGHESVAVLVGRLAGEASALVRNELALAKAEIRETASTAKLGLVALTIGAAVLLAGLLALVAAAILALAQVTEPWLAAFIVGVALALLGAILMQRAKKQLAPPKLGLDRTQSSLHEDMKIVLRRTP